MLPFFHYSVTEACSNTGDVRLVGNVNMTEGRLEICVNDYWGTVCNDGANGEFDKNAAEVVCRQLGFPESGEYFEYEIAISAGQTLVFFPTGKREFIAP